jgi:hypothetical protein
MHTDFVMGKPEGKRPLRKPRYKLEGNIKIDLREKERGDMDWINFTQGRGRGWLLRTRQ